MRRELGAVEVAPLHQESLTVGRVEFLGGLDAEVCVEMEMVLNGGWRLADHHLHTEEPELLDTGPVFAEERLRPNSNGSHLINARLRKNLT